MGFINTVTAGLSDCCKANSIVKEAKAQEDEARNELEVQRSKTQNSLETLCAAKQHAFESALQQFISVYQIVGKVDLSPIKNMDGSINYKQFMMEYTEMKQVSTSLKNLALVSGGGAVVGAAAVGGALGLATLIGTASTGTAIGSLAGAAATNATLAWLGGGAISAGGAGIVGGMVVLGGIAIAPLAIFGMFIGANKGHQKLNNAKEYSAQIDVIVERVRTLITELSKIEKCAKMFEKTIASLEQLMILKNGQMLATVVRLNNRSVLNKYLIDPIKKVFRIQILTDEEATIFRDTANCACLLKQIIDTPLMTGDGAFMEEAITVLQHKQDEYNTLMQRANMAPFTMGA